MLDQWRRIILRSQSVFGAQVQEIMTAKGIYAIKQRYFHGDVLALERVAKMSVSTPFLFGGDNR